MGEEIENLGEIGPEHRFTAGDVPILAAHLSGISGKLLDFLKGELILFLWGMRRYSYPAVAAVIVAAVG
jgi:hypothetical protein